MVSRQYQRPWTSLRDLPYERVLGPLVLLTLTWVWWHMFFGPVSHMPSQRSNHYFNTSDHDRIPCFGPRGHLLNESIDDEVGHLAEDEIDAEYPRPLAGSYEALNLPKRWHTASGRYGAYGYGEDETSYTRRKVFWNQLDWGRLQDDCAALNSARLSDEFRFQTPGQKFFLRDQHQKLFGRSETTAPRRAGEKKGRTAIVLRSWDKYWYSPEDLFNIRSLISEAGLATGGDYAVVMLVHVKDRKRKIHYSAENYDKAMNDYVPPELQSMALLFDRGLMESWYPKTEEWTPILQIMQPLQLFAHFFPDFDHYWQLEMDSRFTTHVGDYLDAISTFARQQPRKQAYERASYMYIRHEHGSYEDFTAAVDTSLHGGGIWGPVRIPDMEPIGPTPPTEHIEDDDFSWGVGEDADLVVLKPCADVKLMTDWVFRHIAHGFQNGKDTPRVSCPPAQARASWNLLNVIHQSQLEKGLWVPSEATLPSWALWHGLKMVYAPQPVFQEPQMDVAEMDQFWNGGQPSEHENGMAFGKGMYNAMPFYNITNTMSWGWTSPFPNRIYNHWMWMKDVPGYPNLPEMPYVLKTHGDEVVAPSLALHPRKTKKPRK